MGLTIFRGRKGFMLTLLALILSSFFILSFSARINHSPDYKIDVVENRISVLNYYVDSFFVFASQAAVISGYSALQGIEEDMYLNRAYSQNLNRDFGTCAVSGTLNNGAIKCPGMETSTLTYYLDNMSSLAQKELKISWSYTINNVTLQQVEDPFLMEVVINLTLNVSDTFANISSTRVFVSYIPITGLPDPIYLINGTYNQTIRKGNITKREGTWEPRDLEQIYNMHEYRYSSLGMSFIDRLRGNFTNSTLGIESVVNHTHSAVTPLLGQNRSIIDYLFWNNTKFNCAARDVIRVDQDAFTTGIPTVIPPFIIDDTHRVAFNISGADAIATC